MADYNALERPKASWFWLKNTSGKADAALTLMVAAFVLSCFLAVAGAVSEVSVGDTSVTFNEFNMGFATVVLVPLIGLYFGRRWTDTQAGLYKQQALFTGKEEGE
jgi:purine-cytosine permease-like protein